MDPAGLYPVPGAFAQMGNDGAHQIDAEVEMCDRCQERAHTAKRDVFKTGLGFRKSSAPVIKQTFE